MKKIKNFHTLLFTLCFLPFLVSAQTVSHEILISGGGGLSSLNYKLPSGKKNLGFGGEAGVGYSIVFIKMVGIHVGADIAFYNSKANLNGATAITENLTDSEGDKFNMHSTLSNYKESQKTMFVNIPVMLHFQAGGDHKFYAMAGVKLGIPVSAKYKVSDATITNEAYYPEYDNWLKNQEFAGFGNFKNQNSDGKMKLGFSAAIAVEVGGKWKLCDKLALYTGAFFDYGLNNIKEKSSAYVKYTAEPLPAKFTTNSAIPSLSKNVNLMAAGVKVRFAILPNGSSENGEKQKEEKQKAEKEKAVKEKAEKAEKAEKEKVVKEKKEKKKNDYNYGYQYNITPEPTAVEEVVEKTILPMEVPLSSASEFALGRPGREGFPATATGITWSANVDATTSKFTTAPNAIVFLPDQVTYNSITTQEKLKEAFESGNKAGEFTAKAGSAFKPQYFIVKDGEALRLIEMTNLIIKAGESRANFTEKH